MKVGRNDPCPCGSGKKYKHCCYEKDSIKHEIVVEAEPAADEEAADDSEPEAQEHHHTPHRHNKGRARFQGDSKTGSATFRPRATRGAQRGS